MITKQFLREVLDEAVASSQEGLLIWANGDGWENFGEEMKPGNEIFDTTIAQIVKGQEVTVTADGNGFSMNLLLAVPVKKLLASRKFFNKILDTCEQHEIYGPITLVSGSKTDEST